MRKYIALLALLLATNVFAISADPVRIEDATDNSRRANVTAGGALKVDASASTQPVSGSVSVSNFPATQPVSGSVSVSNLPATQKIEGASEDGTGTNVADRSALIGGLYPINPEESTDQEKRPVNVVELPSVGLTRQFALSVYDSSAGRASGAAYEFTNGSGDGFVETLDQNTIFINVDGTWTGSITVQNLYGTTDAIPIRNVWTGAILSDGVISANGTYAIEAGRNVGNSQNLVNSVATGTAFVAVNAPPPYFSTATNVYQLGPWSVSLGTSTGKTLAMKTGSIVTTAVTADQVVLTYTVTSGKTFYLEYANVAPRLTTYATTATNYGDCSLESPAGTKLLTVMNAHAGEISPIPFSFGEPLPIAAGVVVRIVCTPAATTSFTWRANFGGYEK